MLAEKLDRRSQKTRSALHAAFVELVLDQGYDALKIGSVAERANVGRSTFYEHYRTKQDLLKASISQPFSILADLALPALPVGGVEDLLQHFRQNQQVARVLLGSPTRPLLANTLAGLIAARLAQAPVLRPLAPLELIARQIADSQLALVESWVIGRPACSIEAATAALIQGTRALASALAGLAAD
ncbi:TetR/AcrR family transcriptional regulator [Undibacterium sp. TJN25]|uniref:TetR/AcrR family transcriptional regulator n=1 Tax=Undibacterium sp. TJN25 TaxID=3413056 RepID=UPI003BF3DDC1